MVGAPALGTQSLRPWATSVCLVAQSCPTLCNPMDCSLPVFSIHGDSPGKNYWSGWPCPPPRAFTNPMIEPRSPTLQAESLPSEPPGKSLNTFNLYLIYFAYHPLHRGERVMLLLLFSHSVLSHSCDPMEYSPPGSSVHGISQARILQWVAIPFFRGYS